MPDPGLAPFTTVFRAADPHRVKRNRQAVSCTACQRRKSKCDRRHPCGACEKRGDGEACQFSGGGEACQLLSSSGGGGGGHKEVQMRLRRLEEMVKGLVDRNQPVRRETERAKDVEMGGSDDGVPATDQDAAVGDEHEPEADYHGATSWTAVVDSIHDIQTLLSREDAPDAAEHRQPGGEEEPDVVLGDVAPITLPDIVGSLPPRAEADRLVSMYFNAKFIAVPFLHTHHFRRRYEAFWEAPAAAPLLWVSIMFSVLAGGATIARIKDPAPAAAASTGGIVDAVDPRTYNTRAAQCLVAGKYLRAKAYSVEAMLMYAHCRHIQNHDADSTLWSMYGLAVRLAQRRGYHRDAAKIGLCISPFEAEMRRRTWFMVQSSDLLFSFQHGMPSMIDEDACDADHPTILTDEDFDEDTAPLPPPRPPTDPIPILAYSSKSRLCRILRRVARHALSTSPVSYAQTQALHAALEAWHDAIPACLRVRPIRSTAFTDANYTIMHRLVLELMYLTTLCVLHRPYLTLVGGGGGDDDDELRQYRQSRQLCRDAAGRLLGLHIEFDKEIRPGGRMYEDRYMVSSLTYHHFLLAAMVLCLDLSESTDLRLALPQCTSCIFTVLLMLTPPSSLDNRATSARLLHTIYDILSVRSASSLDAAHASRILRAILIKVETPPSNTPSPSSAAAAVVPHDKGSRASSTAALPSRDRVPLAQGLPEGGGFALDAADAYPVNFDEVLPPESFFAGGDSVDWHSLDQFLRIDHSDMWNQTLTDSHP
ncbi:transcriptional regulatory protein [Tolypocladium capitatum]|uniref:Transcriptional regulatory protein n=1 Tax=Tolypocladium capitatum TaxID=45235 RepID=A0A2K3Q8H7_9HYPO|nr:transcriptional regulatory protein [Tolypocladium capitatum]